MKKKDTNTRIKKQIQIESKNASPTKKSFKDVSINLDQQKISPGRYKD